MHIIFPLSMVCALIKVIRNEYSLMIHMYLGGKSVMVFLKLQGIVERLDAYLIAITNLCIFAVIAIEWFKTLNTNFLLFYTKNIFTPYRLCPRLDQFRSFTGRVCVIWDLTKLVVAPLILYQQGGLKFPIYSLPFLGMFCCYFCGDFFKNMKNFLFSF